MRRAVITTAALALLVAAAWLTARAPAVVAAGPDAKGLTAVPGIRVGHHTLTERPTGCTVIVVDGSGAVGGISQRGGAPGTRETDLLDPLNMVDKVNAVVLSGGSAYGIDAAQGVVRYLEEKGVGWPVGANGVVPIVPAAILMDLGFGGNPEDAIRRPTAATGLRRPRATQPSPRGTSAPAPAPRSARWHRAGP